MAQRSGAVVWIGLIAAVLSASSGWAGEGRAGADLFAQRFRPPPAKKGYSYPDCYCRDTDGQRVEIGERACLRIGDQRFTALCDMSLNNPVWRRESEGCGMS